MATRPRARAADLPRRARSEGAARRPAVRCFGVVAAVHRRFILEYSDSAESSCAAGQRGFARAHPGGERRGHADLDVTQNSYPIYLVDEQSPTASVVIANYFSYFEKFDVDPDGVRRGAGFNPMIPNVPILPAAKAGGGSDDQVLFWNPATGSEWSLWQFSKDNDTWRATNGYFYNTRARRGRVKARRHGLGVRGGDRG